MSKLVEHVKAYALEHYSDGGWDVIVETWDDADIAQQIKGARDGARAVKKMREIVEIYAEQQADAANSSGELPAAPRKRAARKAPAKQTPRTPHSKPTDELAAKRAKKAAPKATKSDGRALATLSSDQDEIPADADELRKLIKVTRDRRWRAGKRGDAQLEAQMDAQVNKFIAALAKMKG